MHAEAGAIEVVGGMEGMWAGGGKRRARPPLEFQTATGGTGAVGAALRCSPKWINPKKASFVALDGAGILSQVNDRKADSPDQSLYSRQHSAICFERSVHPNYHKTCFLCSGSYPWLLFFCSGIEISVCKISASPSAQLR